MSALTLLAINDLRLRYRLFGNLGYSKGAKHRRLKSIIHGERSLVTSPFCDFVC
jgi:hypothetical protein